MKKRLKLFLDTSAILTGLNSPISTAGEVLVLGRLNSINLLISEVIVDELERNIKKFPLLNLDDFWILHPQIVPEPTLKEIKRASEIMNHQDDAPILAAAIKAKPDFLITWNTKHFFTTKIVQSTNFIICTPTEFIKDYWYF